MNSRALWMLVFTPPLMTGSCGREPTKHIFTKEGGLLVKHRYVSMSTAGWKAELWLDAGIQGVGAPVDVWVRLTPVDQKAPPPKAKIRLTIREPFGKELGSGTFYPPFEDCSTMPKRMEMIMPDDGTPAIEFPPKDKCWETRIKDAFNSDPRSAFPRGDYTVSAEITLTDGPRFPVQLLPLKLIESRDPSGK